MSARFITAEEFRSRLSETAEIAPLDVRDEGIFSAEHILQARCLPVSQIEIEALDLVPRLTTPLVLIDEHAAVSGPAHVARERLERIGYRDIAILKGGMAAWKAAGHAVFSGVHVPSKAFGEFVEHAWSTPNISADDLATLKSNGTDVVVLDVRPHGEYSRFHIPDAINVPGVELIHRIEDVASDASTIVVVNCAGRTRSIIGTQSLVNAGLPNPVMALTNGTMGWHLAGHELEKGPGRVAEVPTDTAIDKSAAYAQAVENRFRVKSISPDTLSAWQQDQDRSLYVFDIRTQEEFEAAHIRGARHVPGGQLIQETDRYVGTLGARIVLVDDTGARATMAASWLVQMGWSDAVVLTHPGSLRVESGPFHPTVADPEGMVGKAISPTKLWRHFDTTSSVSVIDIGSSLEYRDGHIPGAWWTKRDDLPELKAHLPTQSCLVLTSGDGQLARIASSELQALYPDAEVRFLEGGNRAWSQFGFPLETGFERGLSEANDVWYKPYDHKDSVEDRMQEYLSWEIDLVRRVDKDGTLKFPTFDASA